MEPIDCTRLHTLRCLDCAHVSSARSEEALLAAITDHVDAVNQRADRAADPHFALHRIDALLAR